ncbi:MAG: hypothetical protein CR971_00285 [candidate division SR1 bacterium]|nr:MAG: hypothetical protein CR971_00285 [candidate division SR1 bacterium]
MKIVVLLIGIALFSVYFYAIGLGYRGFIPFVLFFFFAVWVAIQSKDTFGDIHIDNKYLFLGARNLVNIAIVYVMYILGIGMVESLLGVLGINIIGLLISYVTNLPYAKDITYITYYISALALIVYALFTSGTDAFLTFEYLLGFTMGFLAFLYFIVPLYYPISSVIQYHFVLVVILTLGVVIYDQIPQGDYAVMVLLCVLLGLLGGVWYCKHHPIKQEKFEKKSISVRKILAGERIVPFLKQQPKYNKYYLFFEHIVRTMPNYMKYFLEGANILLLLLFIYYFVTSANGDIASFILLPIHRGIIVVFLINIYVFRKLNFTSILQKIGMFLGVNIFAYLVFFSYFSMFSPSLVMTAIVRNILYSIVIFNLEILFPRIVWTQRDYTTAMVIDSVVTFVNIVLLIRLSISGQLTFAFVFLYLTIKILLLLYIFNKSKNSRAKYTTDPIYVQEDDVSVDTLIDADDFIRDE